jgi:hypothetical protein
MIAFLESYRQFEKSKKNAKAAVAAGIGTPTKLINNKGEVTTPTEEDDEEEVEEDVEEEEEDVIEQQKQSDGVNIPKQSTFPANDAEGHKDKINTSHGDNDDDDDETDVDDADNNDNAVPVEPSPKRIKSDDVDEME